MLNTLLKPDWHASWMSLVIYWKCDWRVINSINTWTPIPELCAMYSNFLILFSPWGCVDDGRIPDSMENCNYLENDRMQGKHCFVIRVYWILILDVPQCLILDNCCSFFKILKGYCTRSRINCGMAKSLARRNKLGPPRQWFGHTTINPWTSAITLLLYTCYFTFRTLYVILSRILHKKQPFRHGIAPNVFPFHACRPYSNGPGPW